MDKLRESMDFAVWAVQTGAVVRCIYIILVAEQHKPQTEGNEPGKDLLEEFKNQVWVLKLHVL
jgi:hypothetical protein